MTGIEMLEQARDPRPGREVPAAHGVRRHRRRDQGDQRHRARLLPAQALGPARGPALPGHRRPARRLAAGATPTTPPTSGSSGTGGPSAATSQDLPGPQPRAVPLVRRRARRRGPAAASTWPRRPPTTCRWCSSPTARRCARPTTLDLAGALGLRTQAEQPLYDVCIVGGGPAGLAAAVYAASEGLSTVIVEREAPGRAGRPERGDRELPRLPEGADRLRPHPARRRAGRPLRRRDGAGPRRRRLRDARAGARGAASTVAARSRRGP